MNRQVVRWGILGTASIATRRLIPAMNVSTRNEVVAIGSRDVARAQSVAGEFGIARAFGSYDEVLTCDAVDAVYIPLPNHMHLEWSLRAIEAGKHVLCEKPIGLSAGEARTLQVAAEAHPALTVMEAFMYRCHPRWKRIHEMVWSGMIGELGNVQTVFTYDNRDPQNIRNNCAMGGGAWLDIGCYGVSVARYLFGTEPSVVRGTTEVDLVFGTDRLTTAVLAFGAGTATVTCATQLAAHQAVTIHGSIGRIEVPLPFNPPGGEQSSIFLHRDGGVEETVIAACDQFVDEVDQFAGAVFDGDAPPVSLDDSVSNMMVLDFLARTAQTDL